MRKIAGTIILLIGVGIVMVGDLDARFFGIAFGIVGLAILLQAQQKN